jgi:hypothetical protein
LTADEVELGVQGKEEMAKWLFLTEKLGIKKLG